MKFEDVLPALKSGKKIRRKCRPNRYYHIENNHIFNEIGDLYTFGVESDILQDDWEIVEEKKKVKLRDLTLEQFGKWKKEHCFKLRCRDCIFERLHCADKTFCWINYKSLFSDEFLDQEVEIEEE